jgi:hypothetical protein
MEGIREQVKVETEPPPATAPPAGRVPHAFDSKSPGLASALSLIPGLGQVYVGYYQRGFVHAIVVAGIITILAMGAVDFLIPLLSLFLVFFWLYNVIDAGRRAAYYNHVLAGGAKFDLPSDFPSPGLAGSVAGGVTLIVGGTLVLLHTVWGMSLDWVANWWPVAPILFGVYLIARAIVDRSSRS